jgi:alpha-tubulin suppressor-like RCC1 family protein
LGKQGCWGGNECGQRNVPVMQENVVAVSCGDFHSVALTLSGKVVRWGQKKKEMWSSL